MHFTSINRGQFPVFLRSDPAPPPKKKSLACPPPKSKSLYSIGSNLLSFVSCFCFFFFFVFFFVFFSVVTGWEKCSGTSLSFRSVSGTLWVHQTFSFFLGILVVDVGFEKGIDCQKFCLGGWGGGGCCVVCVVWACSPLQQR